ncbi:MAG: hypothetical protein Q4C95_00905 [Planctomycetia bacterium]|nr:hypothetical protein [Planctomycetia bacterium]
MSSKLFNEIKNNQGNQFFMNFRLLNDLFFLLLLVGGTLTFCSCRSGATGQLYQPKADDPYAQNAPKNAAEEAYYKDVYSGGWKEQQNPFGMGKSIIKKTGSTSMPEHWATIPEGAVPMSQIRAEASNRKQQAVFQRTPQVTYPNNVPVSGMENRTMNQGLINPQETSTNPAMMNGSSMNNQLPLINNSTNSPQPSVHSPLSINDRFDINGSFNHLQTSFSNELRPRIIRGQMSNSEETGESEEVNESEEADEKDQDFFNDDSDDASEELAEETEITKANEADESSETMNQEKKVDESKRAILKSSNVTVVKFAQDVSNLFDQFDENVEEPNVAESPVIEEQNDSAATLSAPVQNAETTTESKTQTIQTTSDLQEQSAATSSMTTGQSTGSQTLTVAVPQNDSVSQETRRIGGQVQPLNIDPTIAEPWKKVQRPATGALPGDLRVQELDEYIVSGADSKAEAYSMPDWSVHHLDREDTIAHFDTIDGQILVEPSNQVQIYSPRFGSVRQVVRPQEGEFDIMLHNAQTKIEPVQKTETLGIDVRFQEEKTNLTRGNQRISGTESKVAGLGVSNEEGVMEAESEIKLGDMIALLTSNYIAQNDKALLTGGSLAAQSWGELQSVKVALDMTNAQSNVYNEGVETVYVVDDGTKTSKLQLIKIASKEAAQPGELVEFTIRFENVGDQVIGNITILDNLSGRLVYLENSAKSSVPAEFLADQNENGSLILRWEITEPLEPGDFGVVQFLCKVR